MCALEQISDEATSGDSTAKSRGLLRNISQFGFLLGLKAAICLFGSTDDLSRTMQNHALNIRSALAAASVLLSKLICSGWENQSISSQCGMNAYRDRWKVRLCCSSVAAISKSTSATWWWPTAALPYSFPDAKSHFREQFINAVQLIS